MGGENMKVDGVEIVIESNATKACAELDRMIAKLNKVNASILFTGKAGKGSSVSGLTSGLKSYTTSASKATKSTASLAAAFGKFYASYFLVIRGVKALGRAIESSMDYIETYNYYNVIMDKIGTEFGDAWKENGYGSAEEYSKSFKQRLNALTGGMTGFKIGEEGGLYASDSIGLGLDPDKIMGFQAEVSSITNAVGLMGETSLNTSKALTMLSADLSSLKNQDLETVMTNLRSGLIGQSRALYKYGIDITNNTLAEYALANGIKKKVSEMTQAEKMQLRMLAILDQSKVAYGDMANTINGVANQYRIFKQQVSNLARIIGNLFIPVLQKVLPYVNGFIIALQRLFTWVGNLLGVDWSKMMDGISSGYTDTGLEALGDSADDTTDALENANKAAKKLKKTIFGYDQLNIAQDNTEDTGTDANVGGGGIDLSGAIADALGDYESIWDKAMADMENKAQAIADRLIAAFKKGDYEEIGAFIGDKLRTSLENIDWQEIYNVAYKFGYNLADFLNGLITPELFGTLGKTIASSLNTAMKAALGFGETLDWEQMGESIASGINSFFDTFDFATLGKAINTWVQGIAELITTTIGDIEWEDVVSGIRETLSELDIGTVGIVIGAFSLKFLGKALTSDVFKQIILDKLLGTKVAESVGSAALSLGKITLKAAVVVTVAVVGFEVGLQLGDWIDKTFGDGDAHDYYMNFHWTGEGGFFDEISRDWGTTLDGMFAMLNDKENPFISTLARIVVGPFVSSIASIKAAWSDVKPFFEEHSLSDWWESEKALNKQWGTDIANGFSEMRVNAELELVAMKQSMSIWWNGVKLDFVNAIDSIVGYVGTFPGKIWLALNTIQNKFIMFKAGVEDTFSSIGANIKISFENAFDGLKQSWNNFANWLNSKLKFDVGEIKNPLSGEVISKGFSIDLGKIPGFAGGGFPDTSRPFVVGENGPEIFGSINGKAAVAPSGSITDGIKQAVIEGMMEVFMATNTQSSSNGNTETHIHVQFGDTELGVATYKGLKSAGRKGLIPSIV